MILKSLNQYLGQVDKKGDEPGIFLIVQRDQLFPPVGTELCARVPLNNGLSSPWTEQQTVGLPKS